MAKDVSKDASDIFILAQCGSRVEIMEGKYAAMKIGTEFNRRQAGTPEYWTIIKVFEPADQEWLVDLARTWEGRQRLTRMHNIILSKSK